MTKTKYKWQSLRTWGDVPDLLRLTKISRSTLYRILNGGKCTNPMVLKKIEAYYKKRMAELNTPEDQLLEA